MISESKANDEVSGASTQSISNLVRKYFSAYKSGDRKALEGSLSDLIHRMFSVTNIQIVFGLNSRPYDFEPPERWGP